MKQSANETNVEFLSRVCNFATTGPFAQVYAIEMIAQASEQITSVSRDEYIAANGGEDSLAMIHPGLWWDCANEWKQEIAKRTSK